MQATDEKSQKLAGVMSYVIGFVLAVALTLIAYFLVVNHWLSGVALVAAIIGLAIVQLFVQLVFFLHLGRGKEKRWNITAFAFTLLILLIVVGGSLWIMYSLNYNMMMTPEQMDEYMMKESDRGF